MIFSDVVRLQAGSSPLVYDGSGVLRINERGKRLVAMIIGQSASIYTTDEAVGLAIQLDSSNWNGNRTFIGGWTAHAGPATNHAAHVAAQDVIALDIPVAPNSTVNVNITSILGATQTGTHDVTIQFLYDENDTSQQVLDKMGLNVVAAKGGTVATSTALTTTTRTAMTGNAGLLNVPQEASEIIGVVATAALDSAITAAQELDGQIEIDFGISTQGVQIVTLGGGSPGAGTEVEGGDPTMVFRTPLSIPNLPDRELQVNAFITLGSAQTGGLDLALNILWR